MERHISQAPISPAAATEADLYTVPAGYEAIIATLMLCNTHATNPATVRVRKAALGAATNVNQSWFNGLIVGPGETLNLGVAMTLIATDKIRVHSVEGTVVYDVAGLEVA